MSESKDAIVQLTELLSHYPWFAKVAENPILYNSVVAYVHYMDGEVIRTVPDTIDGVDVRIHFLASAPSETNKYVTVVGQSSLPVYVPTVKEVEPELDLHNEIWNLTRICGKDNLVDIFYEVIDGEDAVTDFSKEYPEVRAAMDKLYAKVSFDDLLEELNI